jgi:two-component system chemotaxis sensor kinase CheA
MSLDLSQFLQSFFEECSESLDSTENSLLNLELSGDNTDAIDTIFRGAHSIKGASATFAFNDVASFTHAMETLLDRIRDGKKSITREDIDLLLASVDCVRGMLNAKQSGGDIDSARVSELQTRLKSVLDESPQPAKAEAKPTPKPVATAPKPASDEISDDEFDNLLDQLHGKDGAPGGAAGKPDWRIVFRPNLKMLKNGSDPIRIFRVLESLGELRVTADDSGLPAFADLNPEECHLRWTLELTSQAAREQIEEAFAWVKGDAELEIVRLKEEKKTPAAELAAVNMESLAAPVMSAAQAASTARTAASSAGQEGTSIRVSIDKVDALINMVGELVITQLMLHQQSKRLDLRRHPGMQQSLSQLDRNTRELQESVMRIRMLPISFAFNRFPRLVHDLTQKLGKKVELKMTGESTELDKTVMEKIGDPLVHLVRNSLDHGLERPEVRRAAGKPETGTLHLNAYHQGGNIVIEIADDGAGLPREKILKKAKERGLIGDERSLTDDKIHELIFMPGFSTAEQVSDVSGRGVGMDVVRKNIKALGGTVEIASREGRGTTITIRLPLTLAILDGQSVRVGDENYIIPLVSIVESVKVRKEMVCVVAGKAEIIRLREDYLPVLRLYQIFDTEPRTKDLFEGLLVIVEGEGMKAGLFVDQLLGQQQVVIKSIETNFRRVDSFSGATILGDGTVALILDIPGLIKLAREKIDPDEIERLHQGEHLAA